MKCLRESLGRLFCLRLLMNEERPEASERRVSVRGLESENTECRSRRF